MRVLITGATGFVGGHLAEALAARGDDVYAVSLHKAWPSELRHLHGRIPLFSVDLSGFTGWAPVLAESQPEAIYHLAGYAHVGQSFRESDRAWAGNLDVTRNLYDGVERWGGNPRILYVSSGLVYGEANGACDEKTPLQPDSPYAASKAAADLLSYQVTRHPGLNVVRVRPFNHIGPRQSPQYAIPRFASQIAAIEKGLQAPVLETGDLSSQRDLTDVRDMVRAYIALMEKGTTGEVYNAGSGSTVSMRDVLDRLLARATIKVEPRIRADALRPAETAVTRADTTKLRRETGWTPRIPLDQTLADTLEYWRMHAPEYQ
jgi:GDP-4-dehydro-6-deoxy-D-mannose reductase